MDYPKVVYVKADDYDSIIEGLKSIMKDNDMELKDTEDGKYIFDNGDYTRTFIVTKGINGWTGIIDDDRDYTEELCERLSAELSCFVIYMGIYKNVLAYTVYENGGQTDRYMSSFKYYEYDVDDDVRYMYSGNPSAFGSVMEVESMGELQKVLEDCRNGDVKPEEAIFQIQKLLNMIQVSEDAAEDLTSEDNGEQEDETIAEGEDASLAPEIFYVDFNSINIKSDSAEDVVSAVKKILRCMGYKETEEFSKSVDERKGFFKKILSSIKEEKRVLFYISPSVNGWVTLAGEFEKLLGGEPSEWDFVHIEDRLSEILNTRVINIFADSESWGFSVFEAGNEKYRYLSTSESIYMEDVMEALPEIDEESVNSIFDRQLNDARDIDSALSQFCGVLGIRNYRLNIPMDYSHEEFLSDVLSKLPDGEKFISLKFEEEK